MEKNLYKPKVTEEISIIRGMFYGSTGIICRVGFLFLVNLFLARRLGAESYGIWSLAFIIITFGNAFVLLGLERGISRFIGKYRGNSEEEKIIATTNAGIILVLFVSFLVSLLLFVFSSKVAQLFKIDDLSLILKILSFAFIPTALVEVIGSIFQGYENIKTSRIINSFIPSFLWFAAVGILMLFGKINLLTISVVYLFLAWLSGGVAIYFLFRFSIRKRIKNSLSEIFKSVKETAIVLLSFSFPLLLFNFIGLVGLYSDSLIINYFLGVQKVGIYNIAFRIARLSPFLLLGSIDVFVPLISKNLAKKQCGKNTINELYLRATKWSFIPTLLIIFILIMFSDFFLSWFGGEFLEASLVLKLLLIAYLISSLAGPTEAINIALGDTGFVALYTLLGAVVSIAFCWLLVPRFGIEAAAVVAIISTFLMKLIAFLKLKTVNGINPFDIKYVSFVILLIIFATGSGLLIHQFFGSNIYGVIIFFLTLLSVELLVLKKLQIIDEKDIILGNKIMLKFFKFRK